MEQGGGAGADKKPDGEPRGKEAVSPQGSEGRRSWGAVGAADDGGAWTSPQVNGGTEASRERSALSASRARPFPPARPTPGARERQGPSPHRTACHRPPSGFYLSLCDVGLRTKMSRGCKPSVDDTRTFLFFLVLTRPPGLGRVSCCLLRAGHREHERGLTGMLTRSGGQGSAPSRGCFGGGASPPPGLPHRPRPSWIRRGSWAPRPAGGPCSGWPTAGYRRRSAAKQQSGDSGTEHSPQTGVHSLACRVTRHSAHPDPPVQR